MLSCLQRSGYPLEGRLIERLSKAQFFVEASKAYLDRRTGVSREIDIQATNEVRSNGSPSVGISTILTIESINNSYPVVLLTKILDEMWYINLVRFTSLPNKEEFYAELNGIVYTEQLIPNASPYAQYCTFTRKKDKGEFMAHHSDDLHGAIQKCAECVVNDYRESLKWNGPNFSWEVLKWIGMIILRDDLFVFDGNTLCEIDAGYLQYNFHFQERSESIVLPIITERFFSRIVAKIREEDERVLSEMAKLGPKFGKENFEAI
jgi:hypothetical protein